MTVEPGQEPGPPRRKFDDIASLFGAIVPPPGPFPRAVDNRAAPSLPPSPPPELPPEPQPPLPMREPSPIAWQDRPENAEPDQRPAMRPTYRPHPNEIPWPDAFEPRPNYRRREPRNWSWLLLIPVGFVAAVGITTLDPRTIRGWLEDHVFHRASVPGTTDPPPLLATTSAPPAAPVNTPAPVATPTPTPPPAPAAEAFIPYPALPTSPVPVPPGTEVSPPPVDPAQAVATAVVPIHITIQYRRNIPGSDGEAHRVAALLQSYGGSIELHPNATTVRVPTINYYNPLDKVAATALATVLANEAANWTVRAGTAKFPLGTLDVWLP